MYNIIHQSVTLLHIEVEKGRPTIMYTEVRDGITGSQILVYIKYLEFSGGGEGGGGKKNRYRTRKNRR